MKYLRGIIFIIFLLVLQDIECPPLEPNTADHDSKGLTEVPSNKYPATITQLILTNNSITELENDCFSNYPKVTFISVKKNNISLIQSNAFSGLKRLQILDLSDNKIERIYNDTFVNVPMLDYLYLSSNPLILNSNDSPYIVSKSITNLFLSNASLTRVNEYTFVGLEKLEELHLDSNKLRNLSRNFLDSVRQIEHVNLDYNPWCSEKIEVVITEYEMIHCSLSVTNEVLSQKDAGSTPSLHVEVISTSEATIEVLSQEDAGSTTEALPVKSSSVEEGVISTSATIAPVISRRKDKSKEDEKTSKVTTDRPRDVSKATDKIKDVKSTPTKSVSDSNAIIIELVFWILFSVILFMFLFVLIVCVFKRPIRNWFEKRDNISSENSSETTPMYKD